MTLIENSSLEAIEQHLQSLGGGNHPDNMNRLGRFECHCLVSLTEEEFFQLVFLQCERTMKIAPRCGSRTLREVARRAINLGQPNLGANWDLGERLQQMRGALRAGNTSESALAVCEARNGEEQYGPWYLQDGSHRALAYATLILLNEVQFGQQRAYCSMSKQAYQNLLARTG